MVTDPNTAPTQVKQPWRTVVRTVFQAIVTLAGVWGLVVSAAGWDSAAPIVAATVGFAAGITRVMAIPAVNTWIERFLPFLAAAPTKSTE